METKYSVAEVCRENNECLPLDPGMTMEKMLQIDFQINNGFWYLIHVIRLNSTIIITLP